MTMKGLNDPMADKMVKELETVLDGKPLELVLPVLGVAILAVISDTMDPIGAMDQLTQFLRKQVRLQTTPSGRAERVH